MKVAIITIHRVLNYGTVLQAFATQELVRNLGYEVKIIDYVTEVRKLKDVFMWHPEHYKNSPLKKALFIASRLPANILKYITFKAFIDKNYDLTEEKYYSISDLKNNPPNADVYLVGSDQVWNSKYNQMVDRGFFLDFGDSSTKRISFASSFGVSKLDNSEFDVTKSLLSKFNRISVREDAGINIVEKMGYQAELVLDPTLMLDKEMWMNYIKEKQIRKKYVLLFLIYNEDNGATEYARKIADEKGIEVVQLYWKPIKRAGVDRIAIYKSPFEFLRYIRDAEYIVTNSFHGTAFALNFNKQFITVARSEFNSRLESILRLCDLENRFINNNFNITEVLDQIDYSKVNNILDYQRSKSKQYLKKALLE